MVHSKQRKRQKKFINRKEGQFLSEEAINFLIEESLKLRLTNPVQSKELIRAAQKIGTKQRLHIPKKYHLSFCRNCCYPLSIKTARIRLNSKKRQIHYLCLNCKNEQRFGYIRKLGG
ncbi:MAG: hypothetical protein JSV04_09290 [Candidatus Heimdallarchaeota archaeon]|nr:MAG: hypothetical protein JSV04_09290 [Candidatus Heimdallarchaeota archaeon]